MTEPTSQSSGTPNSGKTPLSNRRSRGVLQSVLAGLGAWLQELPRRLRPWSVRFQQWWWRTLPQVRSRLPERMNRSLGDRALTALILGLVLLVLWLSTRLFAGSPTTAQISPPVVLPSPVAPAPSLAPDPDRIAAIQDQVTTITEQYSSGLIQSVQAGFRDGSLTVKLGDGWYGLSALRQDQLAAELLQRSRKLDFKKLELTDLEGTLLARTPVVGEEMVILQRSGDLPAA